jgi:ATPase subunit of ABC transporter with duplicated ATPase domains
MSGAHRGRGDDGRRGRGRRGAHELRELEHAMATPTRATSSRRSSSASATRRRASTSSAATRSRRARGRSSRASASDPEVMDDDVGEALGRLEDARRARAHPPDAPRRALLDEPTNHLDIESILWLERFLRDFEGALVITSHDREFMNRLVTKIVEIDGGELTTFTGNYDFYEQRARSLAPSRRRSTRGSRRCSPRRRPSSPASRPARATPRRCSRG